jgi:hypothetical protein
VLFLQQYIYLKIYQFHDKTQQSMTFSENLLKRLFIFLSLLVFVSNCAKVDPVTGEKVLVETDTRKKSREFVDKQGGLFGEFGKSSSGTNFEFSTSNVLWRATLKNLDFLPLANADYSGGIIVYDWYSNKDDKQSIKISVRFLSNELKSSSVVVAGHKKICDETGKCFVEKLDNKFTDEIKESVISTARQIKIEDSKKDTKK